MESVAVKVFSVYDNVMQNADPRVENFFMMSSPLSSLIICVLYVYIVESVLPRYMDSRPPYELRNILIIYNFAMVVLSGYIFMEFALSGWFAGYSLQCQPVDYSKSPQAMRMVNACWWFYISKFVELLDTIFFVLRKKNNQVSFLHVFHHGIMPVSWWFGVKFVPGGFGTFHAFLNSFIHFLMYIYYGLAALGPKYQKYLWWKKYMTSMQITQFLLVCVHSAQLFFVECNYPILFTYWIGSYAVIFLVLFVNFYVKSYRKPASDEKLSKDTRSSVGNGNKKLR
jgi:elongation of very long chain fatty acids protein 7